MQPHAVFLATALASGIITFLMGLCVNLPVVLGPSLALNVLFAQISTSCPENDRGIALTDSDVNCEGWGTHSLPWTDTMGAVFLSGWFYMFFTVSGLRGYLYAAVPKSLRASIAVGTGFFITMVGLKIGHITRVTVADNAMTSLFEQSGCVLGVNNEISCSGASPLTLYPDNYYNGIAHFENDPYARIAVLGIVIAVALELVKFRGSLIIAIWGATFVGINYYRCKSTWQSSMEDDSIHQCVTDVNIWSGPSDKIPFIADPTQHVGGMLTFRFADKPYFWQVVFTFLFFELYDSYGALTGIVTRMGDCRNHPTVAVDRVNRAMVFDGFGVWFGSIIGANSMTVYIESNTGVEVGARTGLAAIVCGCALLLCLFFLNPLVSIIPPCATTCVLVMVGVNSMLEYKRINFQDYIIRLTSFFIIATMGFTFSITNGISVGVIFYAGLQIFAVLLQKVGVDVEAIRPGTKVEFPHPFLILLAVFASCRFSYLDM